MDYEIISFNGKTDHAILLASEGEASKFPEPGLVKIKNGYHDVRPKSNEERKYKDGRIVVAEAIQHKDSVYYKPYTPSEEILQNWIDSES